MRAIIAGTDIVKAFGLGEERTKALAGVDVAIGAGEFVAVMGPSGSGKSTLLFALSGLDTVTSGSVRFDGVELSELNEKQLADTRRTKMGFVFQQPTMLKNLNLLDNIILPAAQDRRKTDALVAEARALMEKTGIAGLEARAVTEVSGGQLQRAGICRALMNKPPVLFADEPTGALDSKSAEEILNLLVEINRDGTAILLVTHDAKVAARADRVLFTKDGRLVSDLPLGFSDGADLAAREEKVFARMADVGL
ncbi:MAG: ABC transporter ATP-binding protein [Propionibacteriaceae bacterium]|jgi:putative ABC transport system ATP-binding protein|nr:ABC transporter ATP-binding protein [Propionibacteriaceae bacterium]